MYSTGAVKQRRQLSRIAALPATVLAIAMLAGSALAQGIPERYADTTYWRLIHDISEPGGYFRSDNFASNEWTFQWVIPELNRITSPNGVYLGVGPDQNFTYIAALKPRVVFILDIRRQNMMLHLMYKALMELSPNRVTFASKLYSRQVPAGVSDSATADQVITAVFNSPRQQALYDSNLNAIRDHLTRTRGFPMSNDDLASLQYVYSTFYSVGPGITYTGQGGTPTWWDLQVETDGMGQHRSYMSSEANYRYLRDLHQKNLIVPLVGDFGGPKALRALGKYLTENRATVTAFYLSNVEQYLFQSADAWSNFYSSAATLPLDSSSTFIRSVFNNQGAGRMQGNGRTANLLASMQEQLKMFQDGRLNSYQQVIATSR